jgi:hypothetical protein
MSEQPNPKPEPESPESDADEREPSLAETAADRAREMEESGEENVV